MVPDATDVTVTESTFPITDEGVKLALGQNAGWTYALCGLKAYVQVREGLNRTLTDFQTTARKAPVMQRGAGGR